MFIIIIRDEFSKIIINMLVSSIMISVYHNLDENNNINKLVLYICLLL